MSGQKGSCKVFGVIYRARPHVFVVSQAKREAGGRVGVVVIVVHELVVMAMMNQTFPSTPSRLSENRREWGTVVLDTRHH